MLRAVTHAVTLLAIVLLNAPAFAQEFERKSYHHNE